MKVTEIDTLPTDRTIPTEKRALRRRGPRLLASVINDTQALPSVRSLDDLRPEHIKALSGGKDALAYLINHPAGRVIIKMGTEGILAEIETIHAWKQRSVRVPAVLSSGIVPVTKTANRTIRYLVQEAMTDTNDRLVETCADYLTHQPHQARKIGQQLGKELNKIHSCVSRRQFGEFKDSQGSTSSYKTWNGYVSDSIRKQRSYLLDLGITEADFAALLARIDELKYVRKGRYLHGDFSVRNVAVRSKDPLKVSVFDPNPLIGDPTWDVSFLANNYEFKKRRLQYDDSQRDLYVVYQQLWIGFRQRYVRQLDDRNLMSAQLIQAIYQAQYTQSIGDSVGLRVRKNFILELVDRLGSE